MAIQDHELFFDERLRGWCILCGEPLVPDATSRDHVPSRILLDKPYPADLPVVFACTSCNRGLSLDEEYVAAVIDCALVGSAQPSAQHRPKIRRILERGGGLLTLLGHAQRAISSGPAFEIDRVRMTRVLRKLAHGHWFYQNAEVMVNWAHSTVGWVALHMMSVTEREAFEAPFLSPILPELGSRQFIAAVTSDFAALYAWQIVQTNRYRYMAGMDEQGAFVRIVLSEYLAAVVSFQEDEAYGTFSP